MLSQEREPKRFDTHLRIRKDRSQSLHVVACGSAIGQIIPPTVIFESNMLKMPGLKMNYLECHTVAATLVG